MDAVALALREDIEAAKRSLVALLSDGQPRRAYKAKLVAQATCPAAVMALALNRLIDSGDVKARGDLIWVEDDSA